MFGHRICIKIAAVLSISTIFINAVCQILASLNKFHSILHMDVTAFGDNLWQRKLATTTAQSQLLERQNGWSFAMFPNPRNRIHRREFRPRLEIGETSTFSVDMCSREVAQHLVGVLGQDLARETRGEHTVSHQSFQYLIFILDKSIWHYVFLRSRFFLFVCATWQREHSRQR